VSTRRKLDEIVESFATLEDPRPSIHRRHPLPSILVLAVLAVLAGAAGPTAIARRAKFKEELLPGILDLPSGIPGKVDVELFARAVRGHWSVGNACHRALDVTSREDDSRLRARVLGANITRLYRFTLSILKQHPDRRMSLIRKRRGRGRSDKFLMEIINTLIY
jgi:hypothetical protein